MAGPDPIPWTDTEEFRAGIARGLVYNREALPRRLIDTEPPTADGQPWPVCRSCGRAAPAAGRPYEGDPPGPWPDRDGWFRSPGEPDTWDCPDHAPREAGHASGETGETLRGGGA